MNLLVCSGICDVSDSLNERCAALEVQLTTVQEENTRLRAAIEPTTENAKALFALLAPGEIEGVTYGTTSVFEAGVIGRAKKILVAIRTRAGESP